MKPCGRQLRLYYQPIVVAWDGEAVRRGGSERNGNVVSGTIEMPLYEYKCRKCAAIFEVLQKFSDAPLKTHAGCGGTVERLLSAPAFQFKGSGWYITDYAKKSGSNGGSSAATSESKSAASTGDSKDSKKESASGAKDSSTAKSSEPAPSSSKS